MSLKMKKAIWIISLTVWIGKTSGLLQAILHSKTAAEKT
jgi:hypothetical protein